MIKNGGYVIKKINALSFLLLGLFSSTLSAAPAPVKEGGFSAGIEVYKPYVKEHLTEGELDRMIGLSVDYDHPISQSRFMRWHAYRTVEHKKASGEHKGIALDFGRGQQHEMRAGFDYLVNLNFSDTTQLTPHVGLQYRRFVHSGDPGQNSYNHQKAHYTMAPIGIDLTTRFSANWGLSFSGEYQYLIYGQQVAYTSDRTLILPTLDDIKANGHGVMLGADLIYHWNHARMSIGATIQSWEVETNTNNLDTVKKSEGFMPSNQESQLGMHLRFYL